MKKLIFAGALSACGASLAFGSIPVGRGEISMGASASATYDSNVSGRRGAEDDYYGTFAPRVSYIRRAGKIEADANLSVAVTRYREHKEFDSENVSADASLRLSQTSFQKISGSLTISYIESFDADLDVNQRIKTEIFSVSAQGGLITGPRTSFSFNGSYSDSDRLGASDQKTFTGGAGFNYKGFLDNTTLGLIYGYTRAESSGENLLGASLDQEAHSFSVSLSRPLYRDVNGMLSYGYRFLDRSAAETANGARSQNGSFFTASVDGPFLPRRSFPKIKSHASLSYQDAQTPGVNDVGGKQVTGDIGVTWDARQSTAVTVGTNRSQRLSSTDLTVISSRVHASVSQQLRHNLSGSVGASYNWETYRGIARKDEVVGFDSALNYTFARGWVSSASYRYTSTSSSVVVADFVRHVATVTLGYTF